MIRKVVIPVAGWGTRVLPATKSIPKPLLPVGDVPAIHHIVEEAVASGVEHVILVTSRHMRAVEDYFDENPELVRILESGNKNEMLRRLRNIENMARVSVVRQPSPRGLGHAVYMAREIVGDEPFAVMLGDDLVRNDGGRPCLRQLIDVYEEKKASVIGVMRVPESDVSKYGIIAGEPQGDRLIRIQGMVEKPSPSESPSQLAVVGRYILAPEIFETLALTPPGKGGEIQLTDAMAMLLNHQPMYAYEYEGIRYDTGDTLGWLTTCIEYTMKNERFAAPLREYLRGLRL